MTARPGVGLVGDTHMLVHPSDMGAAALLVAFDRSLVVWLRIVIVSA